MGKNLWGGFLVKIVLKKRYGRIVTKNNKY